MRTCLSKKNRCLVSQSGMTLIELLSVVLILSLVVLMIGAGMVMVKNTCQKITRKAEAQQILVTTAELLRDEFACALEVEEEETEFPKFLSGNSGRWIRLEADAEQGIYKCSADSEEAESRIPFLSSSAMAEVFYTTFDSYTCEAACFTMTGLAVYEKRDAEKEVRVPVACLPELTVRAVNLEENENQENGIGES